MGIKWQDRFGELWTAVVFATERGMRFVELTATDGYVARSDLRGRDVEPDDCYDEVAPSADDVAAIREWDGVLV